jgi:cytochrome c1
VAAFLMWAAEPKLDERKQLGAQVFVFLILLTVLLYFTKRQVWYEVKHHPELLEPRPPNEYSRS